MQAELNFYYGPMGCGKTRELQKILYSKREDGFYVAVLKPKIDKRVMIKLYQEIIANIK